jgi:hypothetical protein
MYHDFINSVYSVVCECSPLTGPTCVAQGSLIRADDRLAISWPRPGQYDIVQHSLTTVKLIDFIL